MAWFASENIAAIDRPYQTIQWELHEQPAVIIWCKKIDKFEGKAWSLLFKL